MSDFSKEPRKIWPLSSELGFRREMDSLRASISEHGVSGGPALEAEKGILEIERFEGAEIHVPRNELMKLQAELADYLDPELPNTALSGFLEELQKTIGRLSCESVNSKYT